MLRLVFVLVAAVCAATPALAAPRPSTCNPRGSWVASTAETNRFMQALNPTQTSIMVVRGAMSATFDRGHLSYGSLSLTLTGELGRTRIKEVVDVLTEAPYRVRGRQLVLGAGSYSLHYISVTLYPRGGGSTRVRLPDSHIATRAVSVGITCTSSTLQWTVPLPSGGGVPLTFRRDR